MGEVPGQSNIEREFRIFDDQNIWAPIYYRLRNQASIQHNGTVTVARQPANRGRNRYRDVSPYDHSRVKLIRGANDYINANHVEVPLVDRRYILTQGPLEDTCGHFWQMVFEQGCSSVIMLNRVMENGTWKCAQYFPAGEHCGHVDSLTFEDEQIRVRYISEENLSYFIIRQLELTDLETNTSRTILHFHYLAWPDFGVPQSPAAFLSFLLAVRRSGVLNAEKGAAVVHCSAGIGRSGTFCVVDASLLLAERTRALEDLNLQGLVLDMRGFRMGLIQTPHQLRFSYQAVLEGAYKLLNSPEGTTFESLEFVPDEPPPPVGATSLSDDESDSSEEDEIIDFEEDSESESDATGPVPGFDPPMNHDMPPPPLPPKDYMQREDPGLLDPMDDSDRFENQEVVDDILRGGPPANESRTVGDGEEEASGEVLVGESTPARDIIGSVLMGGGASEEDSEEVSPGTSPSEDDNITARIAALAGSSPAESSEPDRRSEDGGTDLAVSSSDLGEGNGRLPSSGSVDDDGPTFGVRRRNREEIKQRTQEKIASMKQKQVESEIARKRKKKWFKPTVIGVGLLVLVGGYFAGKYFFSGN